MARPALDLGAHTARIGQAVRTRREQLGLERAAFARASPTISYRLLQDLEHGRRPRFSTDVIRRLERKLGWPCGSIERMAAGDPAPDVSDVRPAYMSEAAERIDLGDGYGAVWTETISEVAAEVDDVAEELGEDAEELRERVRQNIIRQTRLFLDMERERADQERQRRAEK